MLAGLLQITPFKPGQNITHALERLVPSWHRPTHPHPSTQAIRTVGVPVQELIFFGQRCLVCLVDSVELLFKAYPVK